MARPNYLIELRNRAETLRRLFSGTSLKWFESALSGQRDDNNATFGPDKIYEFLCYFTIIKEIEGRVSSIELVQSASGSSGHRFTYGPGRKENFAFFRFTYLEKVYDLCFGTTLPDFMDPTEPEEAPDISLQFMGAKATFKGMVTPGAPVRIWDAKYHEEQVFSKHDYQQLYAWCDILGLRPPGREPLPSGLLPIQLERPAVITNAKPSPLNSRITKGAGLAVLFEFHGDFATVVIAPP